MNEENIFLKSFLQLKFKQAITSQLKKMRPIIVAISFIICILTEPLAANPNILKELKKMGKEVVKGAEGELKKQSQQILNSATSDLLGGDSKSSNWPSSRKKQTAKQYNKRTVGKPAPIGNGIIQNIGFDNLGLNENIFRLDRDLIFDRTGLCLKGFVTVSIDNQGGNRLFCIIEPLMGDDLVNDGVGVCRAIFAFEPTSSNYCGDVRFAIPYQWSGMNMNSNLQSVESFNLRITIADFSQENPILTAETVTIDQSRINLDKERITQSGLSEILGGSSTGNFGLDMISGMFGSGDTITHKCGSCDGTGLCPYCDGKGFIEPSSCSKCSSNPGVCRRCHGKGEETSEVEINTGFW